MALTDAQLAMITAAASPLPPDKRVVLLERIAGQLRGSMSRGIPTDADLARALERSLQGLAHGAAA